MTIKLFLSAIIKFLLGVVIAALDAHAEEEPSEYVSAEDEAEKISKYVVSNYGKDVFLLAGLSMGGVVANKIFKGYAHGELAIYHPDEWCEVMNIFISNKELRKYANDKIY